MSKRFIFPQQHGDRKKAKLDVTISDHNFPLSQNTVPSKESKEDTWGDDNDDEILLLASQACEQAYSNDVSTLPDFSVCMQPSSTSTQVYDPGPSTSRPPFSFKKPSTGSNLVSTNLKDKCNRISSPLPGMSSKVMPKTNEHVNLTDDLIFNDKIYKGQDSDYVYKQLLQLQEENTKLKSENGKLLEKCVTKEGEASILRTQLKSCQGAVDNARLERIKAQEKVQMEWMEKLAAANTQMHDLRTQLDFKNLEIISVKEKCRMLESNKVKLTQVTVPSHDISLSHRNSICVTNDVTAQMKRAKVTSSSVQTDDKTHFLKLNTTYRSDPSKLNRILTLILEPSTNQHSILDYNEKLQNHADLTQNKCRVYSTFHRVAPAPRVSRELCRSKATLSSLHGDLTCMATGKEVTEDKYYNILNTIKSVLEEVHDQLEAVSHKMTSAFQREMDERYIEATATFIVINDMDLLTGRPLYRGEQAISARRMTAVLVHILEACRNIELLKLYEERCEEAKTSQFIQQIYGICTLLDATSCALLYSGLLLSITHLLHKYTDHPKTVEVIKLIITSRPQPMVSCRLLALLRRALARGDGLGQLCPGCSGGNLKLDYDQGVLLYKKDSCYVQVLLKQIETALKCIEKQNLTAQAIDTTRNLIGFYTSANGVDSSLAQQKNRCDCQLILIQVIVYALRICAVMWKSCTKHTVSGSCGTSARLLAVCRGGVRALCGASARGAALGARLAHDEGHLLHFLDLMRTGRHGDAHANMLSELSSTFQSSPEDVTSSFHRQAWLKSFQAFSITD